MLTLGASLIVIGAVFTRLDQDWRVRWPGWVAPPVGLVSGLLTGMFGTGGPPLIVYYRLSGVAKTAFRGNLMAIFLLKTFVRLPAYAVGDLITVPRLGAGLAVMPAVAWGTRRCPKNGDRFAYPLPASTGTVCGASFRPSTGDDRAELLQLIEVLASLHKPKL